MQQFADLKIKIRIVGDTDPADRIAAGRVLLRRSFFSRKRCAQGLDNLRAYHYKFDDKLKTLSAEPEHDFSSHGSDSFGYGAVAYREINPTPFRDVSAELSRLPTLNDIAAEHDRNDNRERRIA